MPTTRTTSKTGTRKPATAKEPAKRETSSKPAAAATPEAAPAPARKRPDPKDTVSLIGEKEKIVRPRPVEGEAKPFGLPPISKIKAAAAPPAPVPPPAPQPVEPAAPAAEQPPETAVPAPAAVVEEAPADEKIIHIKPPIIVRDLAAQMGLKPFKVIADLMELQIYVAADATIDAEIASKLCAKHGFVFEKEKREKGGGVHKVEQVIEAPKAPEKPKEEELKLRPPIVTFMGHVDHGKTSLMDAIRKTRVVAGEAGGITQHIGAYSVDYKGSKITFLDTPGHAAFTAMRARGANVTDIVVLVVAADDGLMPQTLEAISHAKAANVKIMVAINKIDLPSANVDRVKAQLQEQELTPEDWGGETICCPVSATKGSGVDHLIEMITLQSEVLELKASPDSSPRGTVIEAQVEAGRGPTATVLVGMGTLKVGQPFICGNYWGKVKSLSDDRGQNIKEAPPSSPARVLGFSGLPNAGDELVVMESEKSAKLLSEERLEALRKDKLASPQRPTLENLFENLAEDQKKVLKVVLKCDVQGSLEALLQSLKQIDSKKIDISIIHAAVGPITESDILLASASNAIVIGFNVKVESASANAAKREGVQIKLYSIIYELIDQVKEAMAGMLDPELRETVIGHAEVKKVFDLTRGTVAGCIVTDGRISRTARARVLRGKQPIYDGGLATLRRFHDDVKEVRSGLECGIKLGDFTEYEPGDIIQCYQLDKVAQKL